MNFEKAPEELNTPEIPEEINAYWKFLKELKDGGKTNPLEYFDWLKGMATSLAGKNPEFKSILSKHDSTSPEGFMDALEEYSRELTSDHVVEDEAVEKEK